MRRQTRHVMYQKIKRRLLRKVVADEVIPEGEEVNWEETDSDKVSLSEEEVEEEEEDDDDEIVVALQDNQEKAKGTTKSKGKKQPQQEPELEIPAENKPAFIYENTDFIEGNDPLTRVKEQLGSIRGSRTHWISAPALYHFYFDDTWKCGFRNIQILALAAKSSDRTEMEKRLFHGCGFIPDVASIQR